MSSPSAPARPPSRALFIATNGAGLGHLTPSMAIARRLPPDVEPVVLTTSRALSVVREEGFYVEHFPPPKSRTGGEEGVRWNARLAARIRNILDEYDPGVIVFDGTYPYQGVIQPAWRSPKRSFVWSRDARGWRPGEGTASLDVAWAFDRIIERGELSIEGGAIPSRRASADVVDVSPIIFCDEHELLGRSAAESALGLTQNRTNVLIQLGAGNINDTNSPAGMCFARLQREGVQVVVADSPISERPIDLPRNASRVRAFPISKLYRAFDFVVSAAGYSSVHELIAFGIPAMLVPNTSTALDDQVARAIRAERLGVARQWDGADERQLEECLDELLDDEERRRMTRRAREHRFANGAAAAAELIAELGHSGRLGATRIVRAVALTSSRRFATAARSLYRWLVDRLPSPLAERLRASTGRRVAPSVRKSAAARLTPPEPGDGDEVESVCLALGASESQLDELIDDANRLAPAEPSRLLFVTDCDALDVFTTRGYLCEYVPPRSDWEMRAFAGDYEGFMDRRIAAIADAYAAKRILKLAPQPQPP